MLGLGTLFPGTILLSSIFSLALWTTALYLMLQNRPHRVELIWKILAAMAFITADLILIFVLLMLIDSSTLRLILAFYCGLQIVAGIGAVLVLRNKNSR